MTESEAIKKHIDECNNRIENISFFMDSNSDANKEECRNNIEILQNVINILEKHIPKKLKIRKATDDDIENELRDFITVKGKICLCPTCGDCIAVNELKYCWECGQKIDWSDEE